MTACTTGFLYNRLDWLVSWYVNGLVSLEQEQERQLRDTVHRTLAWHRQEALPAYVQMLEEMADEAAGPITAERLEAYYRRISRHMNDFVRRVNPDVAALLRTLGPEQIAELERSLEEDNQELMEDFGGRTPEIRQRRRLKSTTRALQRFTGKLSHEQRLLVKKHLARLHDLSAEWLERRRYWQAQFLGLLRAAAAPGFEEALLELALHPDRYDPPVYQRQVELNRRIVIGMVAELSGTLTPRQRERLQRKLRGFADDLRSIAAGG
jgi:hypothetical protein